MNVMRQLALFRQTMQTEGMSHFQFILRTMMLVLSILLTTYTFMSGSGSKGLLLLSLVSYVNITFVIVATVNLFCSCIAEEKEGDTLGLLLMTGLSPFGLILGKSLSRLYIVVQLLLLQLPLIFLAVTQGGVRNVQVMAVIVFCFALIVCLSQMGLFFSVISTRTSSATFMTVLSTALYYLLNAGRSTDPLEWLTSIFQVGYSSGISGPPIVVLLLTGLFFFLLSIFLFNATAYSTITNTEQDIRIIRSASLRFGANAIFDKDFAFHTGGYKFFFTKVLICGGLFSVLSFSKVENALPYASIIWLWAEGAYYSQTIFSREIKDGTLQTLAVLPIELRTIVMQKVWACLKTMIPALAFFVGSFWIHFVGQGDSIVSMLLLLMVWVSHMLISALCSIHFKRMTLVMSLISVVIFSVLYGFCPLLWLLFLPSIVLLAVNVVEKLRVELVS